MRAGLATVAAALVLTSSGGVIVSTQDDGKGVALLLLRLERVVEQGDAAAYNVLLTDLADRARGAEFVDEEMARGMTRAVIRERDRLPLAGTLAGDGYTVAVDVFQEYGDRARIATWWLDVKRVGAAGTESEWLIADQSRLSSVEELYRLGLDATKQFAANNLVFVDEDLKITLAEGAVFAATIDQGTTALVFVGRGDMIFEPAPETEKTQVRIFSDADAIESRLDALYLRMSPRDAERLVASGQLTAVPVDADAVRRAERIFRDDSPKSYALDLGDLSSDTWSLVPSPGDLVAEIHTRRFDTLTYSRSVSRREDITLFDRDRRTTIALYSSELHRRNAPEADADELGDFEVQHYDIDISAIPDRRWIEGRVRMDIRGGERPTRSLTMRLADPLEVQSVVSLEYGRLFSMRIKGQNSLVISLPVPLVRDAELTLTVTYAGRLEPQMVDVETTSLGQFGTPPPAAGMSVEPPEPSLLYSNQINWYPRPAATHYATAAIRITVPANQACIASGERDPLSPRAVAPAGSTPARKTYVFNAVQPLRYFAFVISRLEKVQNVVVDFPPDPPGTDGPLAGSLYRTLNLSIEVNSGHAHRARRALERAEDIARFYQGLIGDSPYPSLTLALIENELPGGHSPGYFAIVNQPTPPLLTFAPRTDPASFEQFPDYFLAHELAHQWWGHAVGWRNYHEQWLSEGLAQYFAALYAEHRAGDAVFRNVMRQMRKWAIDETEAGPISLGYRLGHIQGDSRIFRALVYNKSGAVLHMLRRLLGDDVFYDGVRRFYRDARFRSVGTADLRTAMELAAGRSLSRFFDQWIDGAAIPRVAFSYQEDGRDVVLRLEQQGELFDLPVMITLQFADGSSSEVLVPVTERNVELRLPLRARLRTAEVSRTEPPVAEIVRK